MAGTAGRHRQEDRARSGNAGAACRARRQSRVPQDDRHRRRRRGLRQGRPRHRRDVRVRPAHGREPGAARAAGRLRQRHRQADHHHQQPVPAHAPACVRPHAGRAPAQRAGDRPRRRRIVRPQDPHLRRRIGGDRGGHPARPSRQVHRRPSGIVRLRHSRPREFREGAHRREQVRRDRGLRHRRAVRRRCLFAVSAHQRVRGHPGAQHHRRALPAQALPGARHRGLSEQGADLAISRRRPPDRQYGGRASRGSGSLPARHRSHRDATAQHHARRRLSRDQRQRHQAQGPVAPALPGCPGRAHELCRPARGADASAERRHPPRHRHRHLHQGHGARTARLLRHRRRADLLAGRLRDQARAQRRRRLRRRA